MDKATTFDIEYAGLMSHNPDGTYLYIPPTFTNFHPGLVGCFDESGSWNKITDLCKEGQTQADGYTALNNNLSHNEPKKLTWKPRSSGSENSQHAQSEKASLVTGGLVRREKIGAPFGKPVAKWADENAKKFLVSDFSSHIEKNGLWIIQSTWVANKCAIYMTNSSDKGLDAGLDIAATGGGGDTFQDMKNEGWSTYQAQGVSPPSFRGYSSWIARFTLLNLSRMMGGWLSLSVDCTSNRVSFKDSVM